LSGTNYLSLTEVNVFGELFVNQDASIEKNVALKKLTQQSSIWNGFVPELAVDGIKGQYTSTNPDLNAWWQVDLGTSYSISSVEIINRSDGQCWDRLSDFYIFVSDLPFTSNDITLLKQNSRFIFNSGQIGASKEFTINAKGRYVRIELSGTNYLSLTEVHVFTGGTRPDPTDPVNPSPNSDLTGVWQDDNGATYSIRQIGSQIWWYMDQKPEWANVFKGNLSNGIISGEWCDVPGGKLVGKNTGTITLKVINENRLDKVSASPFPYGGSIWKRIFMEE
jgi:hypothetical protein